MKGLAQHLMAAFSAMGHCFSPDLEIVYAVMTVVDGAICAVAAVQFFRIHFQIRKWTRQKVFHAMVAVANFGYCLYFLINPRAACGGWPCWNNVCGFVLLAVPQIVFLATFLLLLSFWVDLCHQASDLDEEEEEGADNMEDGHGGTSGSDSGHSGAFFSRQRWRIWWKKLRPRGRKAVFVGVVAVICLLTAVFALLIWVGMGHNPINSVAVAELYADLFATLTLLCGGGLAIYGLLLYSKMLRVQSGQTSADLGKVATLAIVCLICFTFRALLVLVNNLRDESSQEGTDPASPLYPLLTFAYYAVGESVPSIFVLICLREMPVGGSKQHRRRTFSPGAPLEEPLLLPVANGLPPAAVVQPAVAPWSVAPPVPPEPGDTAQSAPTSTLEHPRRAKAHALGSKRPISRR